MSKSAKTILEELLARLGIEAAVDERQVEDGLLLTVESSEAGRLIGRQGQTLGDLQYLLNRLLFTQEDRPEKVTVDVGGYRSAAREALEARARDAAEKVRRWGDIVEVGPLSAYDRRIVHTVVRDDPEVESYSVEVEGTSRKAVILRPRRRRD